MTPVRRISIVVPLRNEADRVDALVQDIAVQDFPGEIETLVADGGSTDGSVERLQAAAGRAAVALTVLQNPARTVPPGLNACLARATGDLIVRLDCKSRYPPDYLRLCATAAEETGAWNVGGRAVPVGETAAERAVACAMESAFGGIGWTRHNGGAERVDTDTVYLGAFRPEAFERVGRFREIGENHDEEFNLRLRRGGGRVVFDPRIRAYYTGRRSTGAVFRQYYRYGRWKIPVMVIHRQVLSGRSLVPPVFVGSLAALVLAGSRAPSARRLLAAELAAYAGCSIAAAAASVGKRAESWRLVPRTAAVFPAFHVAYGVGMLAGGVAALSGAARSRLGRARRGFAPAARARARGTG